ERLRDRSVQIDADAVSPLDPRPPQAGGQPGYPARHLRVAQALLPVDERFLVRIPAGARLEHVVDQEIHVVSVLSQRELTLMRSCTNAVSRRSDSKCSGTRSSSSMVMPNSLSRYATRSSTPSESTMPFASRCSSSVSEWLRAVGKCSRRNPRIFSVMGASVMVIGLLVSAIAVAVAEQPEGRIEQLGRAGRC